MASAFWRLNSKIRSNPYLDKLFSTHFWGPVSNFGIPVAAVMDTQKDPDLISGRMTGALCVYSAVFMRYSVAVSPANYILFACHFINEGAQLTQGYRYMQYHYWGGKEKGLKDRAVEAVGVGESKVVQGLDELKAKAKEVVSK